MLKQYASETKVESKTMKELVFKAADKDGHFRRKASRFRDWVSADPEAEFPAEKICAISEFELSLVSCFHVQCCNIDWGMAIYQVGHIAPISCTSSKGCKISSKEW